MPQLVDRRPYPKNIFTRGDVEADQAENLKNHAVSAQISEDAQNFYLTTVWPSLDSLVDEGQPAPARGAAAQATWGQTPSPPVGVAELNTPPALGPHPPPAEPAVFTTLPSTTLESLQDEYQHFYDICATQPAHERDVAKAVARVRAGQSRYQTTSSRTGGRIPWQFVGVIHLLEANCNFGRHLHNGDPMMSGPAGTPVWLRTTHLPPNRPAIWPAPANESDPWVWSAIDALTIAGFANETDWSIPAILWRFERYNGMGYRQFRNPSPFLWSFSQIYRIGKFGPDHHYDPNLRSDQCGAALVLKALMSPVITETAST
jgi:lysozyme family protein